MQNETKNWKDTLRDFPVQPIFNIILFVILVAMVITAVIQKTFLWGVDSGAYSGLAMIDFSDGWVDSEGKPISLNALSSVKARNEDGTVTVSHQLPQNLSQEWDLMFISSNVKLDVYVENEQVFRLSPEHIALSGKSYGTRFCHVSLLSEWAGKTVRIVANPLYRDGGSLRNVYVGDRATYLTNFYLRYYPAFVLSLLIIFIGMLFLIFSHSIEQVHTVKSSLRAFAATSVFFGIWAAIRSMVPTLMLGSTDLLRTMEYPILVILPYTVTLAANGLLVRPRKRNSVIAFCGLGAEVLVCALLALIFGFDLHECKFVIHATMLLSIGFIFWIVWEDKHVSQQKKKTDRMNYLLPVGLIIMLITVVVDLLRYNLAHHNSLDNALFIRVGFFLFQLIVFYRYVIMVISRMRTEAELELYRKMAYKDALTGICNRASFLEMEDTLKQQMKADPELQVACCSLDINYLKLMNDTYGHAMGDRYIQCCAEIIRKVFKGKGKYYRVGGDEFVTFLWGEGAELELGRCLSALSHAIDEQNQSDAFPFPISIAFGYAVCSGGDPKALETAEVLADRRMYEMKKQMKQSRED